MKKGFVCMCIPNTESQKTLQILKKYFFAIWCNWLFEIVISTNWKLIFCLGSKCISRVFFWLVDLWAVETLDPPIVNFKHWGTLSSTSQWSRANWCANLFANILQQYKWRWQGWCQEHVTKCRDKIINIIRNDHSEK